MSAIEKMAGLAMLGSGVLERVLLRRFLLAVASLVVCAVVMGVLLSALLLAGLYAFYHALLLHGISDDMALAVVSGAGVALIALLSIAIFYCFRALQRTRLKPAIGSYAGQMAESFLNGLLTSSKHKATC